MNRINQKYKTVSQIALKDIAEYQRNHYKDKQLNFFSENVVTSKLIFKKEARRLNRELDLRSINMGNKETI